MGFKKGEGGRPKGVKNKAARNIIEAVRARVGDDGAVLVEAAAVLALGTPRQVQDFFGERLRRDGRVILQSIEWLADRGFGKAPQEVSVTGGDGGAVRVVFGGRYKPDHE